MINYSYTPGDKILSLNEDCVEVETDGIVFEMALVDLFESWLTYQLDEEYLMETKTQNKAQHNKIMAHSRKKSISEIGTIRQEWAQQGHNTAKGLHTDPELMYAGDGEPHPRDIASMPFHRRLRAQQKKREDAVFNKNRKK